MLPKGARLVVLLFVGAALAGCSSGGDPAAVDDGGGPEEDALGAIEGIVTDDELRPVDLAQVAVIGAQGAATTGPDGRFRIEGLEPGTYQVAAQRLGYESAAKSVDVAAGATAAVSFELAVLAVAGEPWLEILGPFAGYFDCRMGTPVVTGPCGLIGWPNDVSTFEFSSYNETTALVGETRWDQGTAATSEFLRTSFSYDNRTSSHWFCSVTGTSPTQWKYLVDLEDEDGECISYGGNEDQLPDDEPEIPTPELTLITYVNTPFGGLSTDNPPVHLALQQRFEIMIALFQNSEPEEGYTPFPDT